MIFYELFKYMQSKITDLLWLWLFLSLSVLIALLRSLRSSHIHMRSVNSSISFCDYSMRKRWKQQMMKKKISVDGINYNDWNRKLNSMFLLQLFGTLNGPNEGTNKRFSTVVCRSRVPSIHVIWICVDRISRRWYFFESTFNAHETITTDQHSVRWFRWRI